MNRPNKASPLPLLLGLVAVAMLAVIYASPIWWVSLTAPNYPPEAFPDGVRIDFHINGVFNGCKKVEKVEIREDEALDCVHEMDTINHYVGMYPIAAGGVVERAFSPFLFAMLGIMIVGFVCRGARLRMGLMSVAFVALGIWMYLAYYTADGLKWHNAGYVSALVTSLDQDASDRTVDISPGAALIARLKASLAESEGRDLVEESEERSEKLYNIDHLRVNFEKDQDRRAKDERLVWDGSSRQMLAWHYQKSLGRYFNNPAEITPMVATMAVAGDVLFWGLLAAMVLLLFGARKESGLVYWALILVPMMLPLFFVVEYAAWLWWYGHSLNEMGAFTVKAFMPTVFGQGKVAQFTTHSYPSWGFMMMLGFSLILTVVALLRRRDTIRQRQ